jgi:hypothetical protein
VEGKKERKGEGEGKGKYRNLDYPEQMKEFSFTRHTKS